MPLNFFGILLLTIASASLIQAKGSRGGGVRIPGPRSSGSRSNSRAQTTYHAQPVHDVPAAHSSHISHASPSSGLNPNPGFHAPSPNFAVGQTSSRYPPAVGGYPVQHYGVPMQNNPPRRGSNVLPFGAGALAGGIVGSRIGHGSTSHGHYSGSHASGDHHYSEGNAGTEIDDASDIQSDLSFNSTICSNNNTAEDEFKCDALRSVIDGFSTNFTIHMVNQTSDVNSTNVE